MLAMAVTQSTCIRYATPCYVRLIEAKTTSLNRFDLFTDTQQRYWEPQCGSLCVLLALEDSNALISI